MLRRNKDGKVVVIDHMQTKLRDKSSLKKVLNVWQTYGPYHDETRINLIEAITSNGQTVFCSSTRSEDKEMKKRLGRGVSEEEKAIDFHILDYEPDLTRFS